MLPGGVGANEASVVGILVLLGVNPAAAAAAAVVQRLSLTLVPTAGGGLAYLALRRRNQHARNGQLSDPEVGHRLLLRGCTRP